MDRATAVTAEIRSWIELIADGWERVPALVTEAHRERYWKALGYEDWESYVRAEFGTGLLKLSAAIRREWVQQLTEAGLSRAEIAPVVNVGTATVARDRQAVSSDTPRADFRIMPRLRWRHDGNRMSLDLSDYRRAVHELASIYPEEIRTEVVAIYEAVLSGIHEVLSVRGVDVNKFDEIADGRVQKAVHELAKALA